jgi:hypothetical protein
MKFFKHSFDGVTRYFNLAIDNNITSCIVQFDGLKSVSFTHSIDDTNQMLHILLKDAKEISVVEFTAMYNKAVKQDLEHFKICSEW